MPQLLHTQDTNVRDSLSPRTWLKKNGYNLQLNTRNLQYAVENTYHTIYWIEDRIVAVQNSCGYDISVHLISEQECLDKIREAVSLIHTTEMLYKQQDKKGTLLYIKKDSGLSAILWMYENKVEKSSTVMYESGFYYQKLQFVLHENYCLIVHQDCDEESIEQTTPEQAAQFLVNCLSDISTF